MARKPGAPAFAPAPAQPLAAASPPVPRWETAALAGLLLLPMLVGFLAARRLGVTYDEPNHIASGLTYWHTGTYRMDASWHPPVPKLWMTLPHLFMKTKVFLNHPDFMTGTDNPYARYFLFNNRQPFRTILLAARAMILLWWIPLGIAVWLFLRPRAGPAGALFGVFLLGSCPSLVANSALATTDFMHAACFFMACLAFARLHEKPRAATAAAAGVLLALTLATKASGILLVPLLALLSAGAVWTRRTAEPERFGWWALASFLLAAVVLWVVYLPVGLHRYVEMQQLVRQNAVQMKHAVIFHGAASFNKPWLFAVNILLKTPLPLLLLAAAGLFRPADPERREGLFGPSGFVIAPPLAVFAAASVVSTYPVENRYLLPVYPVLCCLAGLSVAWLVRVPDAALRAAKAGLAVLALAAAAGGLSAHPHYLAYYNAAAGGATNGWRWFVNSNLDWGQGLPFLADWLKERGVKSPYLVYFGVDSPEANGVSPYPTGEPHGAPRQFLAVSATSLWTRALKDREPLMIWLTTREPDAVVAGSILVYDLTGEREAFERLAGHFDLTGDPARAQAEREWAKKFP